MTKLTDWLRLRSGIESADGRYGTAAKLFEAADEIERLTATVDRLPKRADWVGFMPGMKLWTNWPGDRVAMMEVISLDDLTSDWPATVRADFDKRGLASTYRWHVQACYSTREAAEKARTE